MSQTQSTTAPKSDRKMNTVLVTGATGFLGYHVIRLLNERGIKPRALVKVDGDGSDALKELRKLDIDEFAGDVQDVDSLEAACAGADTVLHLSFLISMGSGAGAEKSLYAVNVVGTRNLLDAATRAGAACILVSSSALTVGLNREPQPLDETADWDKHGFGLLYAQSRREAEIEALSRPGGDGRPRIVAVNPSFTMGPADFVGAPANKLAKAMAKPRFRLTAPIGFGVLDVRDYADGVLRVAEHGRHGQRYILSGENVKPDVLLREVAAVSGVQPPRLLLPIYAWMAFLAIVAARIWSGIKRTPPTASTNLVELWGRHAWYDTGKVRQETGWTSRPLRETLADVLMGEPAKENSAWNAPHHATPS